MSRLNCPYCISGSVGASCYPKLIRFGYFYRTSDSKSIQRYRCLQCKRCFSSATFHPCVRQKKRQKNSVLANLLCSGVSLRRSAILLNLNRKTTARKLCFLGELAKIKLKIQNEDSNAASCVEFDDMETFEHTKYKPISITLAVESRSRRILGFTTSRMPAKGLLARKARITYGKRRDERTKGRRELFSQIRPLVRLGATDKIGQQSVLHE